MNVLKNKFEEVVLIEADSHLVVVISFSQDGIADIIGCDPFFEGFVFVQRHIELIEQNDISLFKVGRKGS